MSTTYEYVETDFLNDTANLSKLTREIRQSVIDTADLQYINYEPGNRAWIVFDGDLSVADQDVLDGIVAAHDGESITFQVSAYAESSGTSMTSAGEYTRKLTLLPGELENGRYRIHFYCEVANTNTSGRTELRVCSNQECFANPSVEAENSEDWIPFTGFKVVDVTDQEPLSEIGIEYRRLNKGSAKIRYAKLELYRMEM